MSPRSKLVEERVGSGIKNFGHRGTRDYAPENTYPAFELSLPYTNYFELDVTLCKTGELVVIHDSTLERTTNGKGRVADRTWQELSVLDAGSWFGEKFQQTRIPRLRDLFTLLPGTVFLDIEIKSAEDPKERTELAKAIVQEARPELHRVFVSSFDSLLLCIIRDLEPGFLIGQLLEKGVFATKFPESRPDILLPEFSILTQELVAEAKQAGLAVIPYTVNYQSSWKNLCDWGVQGIITDVPQNLQKFLEG